jgi:ElaB/YqjD/DUF883 family membrane-anchored ribosome-binding protein
METTRTNQGHSPKLKNESARADKMAQATKHDIEHRVEQVRELVDDIRDRAEMIFHEKPYLLPVATGAVGLGVGILIGSRLSRVLFFTAAGAMLSDTIRHRLITISKEFLQDLDGGMSQQPSDDAEDIESSDYTEPSVT